MHEDIYYHTYGWGESLACTLTDKTIGLVGVIGAQYLPNKIAPWWLSETTKGEIIQGYFDAHKCYCTMLSGVKVNNITDAVAVDGLWFSMTRLNAYQIKFDEETYNSFHCYDIDVCMQIINNNKRVVVIPNILIEHYSMGNVRKSYFQQLQIFYNKWQKHLPIWRGLDITKDDAIWVSQILERYQQVVYRNVILEHSWAYRIGSWILKPYKVLKNGCKFI